MSADPRPDAEPSPEIVAFFDEYAEAASAFDAEAVAALIATPNVVSTTGHNSFIETEAETLATVGEAFARWKAKGVTSAAIERIAELPLPDDSARVTVHWLLRDAGGGDVLRFPAIYTLAKEDGDWAIMAVDAQGEADAWAGAGRA